MLVVCACGARSTLDVLNGDGVSVPPGSGGAETPTGGAVLGRESGGSPADGGQPNTPGTGGMGSGGAASTGGVDSSGGQLNMGGEAFLWRQSSTELCLDGERTATTAESLIWADERGVFVASAEQRDEIHFNDGTGWSEYWSDAGDSSGLQLSGVSGGSLFLAGADRCSIVEIPSTGKTLCSGAPAGALPLFMVGPDDGFAGDLDRLLIYDGDEWRQLGDPLPQSGARVLSLWADDEFVLVATQVGLYQYARPSDTPILDSLLGEQELAAVWATHKNEAWVGTPQGQILAYDGTSWQNLVQVPGDCPGIEQIWSDGAYLYLRTDHALYSVTEEGEITTLFDTGCFDLEHLTSLWGLSSSEAFFATQVAFSMSQEPCRGVTLYWTDGQTVTEF